MTVASKYFVDVFGEWVKEVQENFDLITQEKPYYLYGHPLEIANTLTEKSKTNEYKYKKYPAICLLQDFEETIDHIDLSNTITNLSVLIVSSTKQNYKASERYTNVFKPVLYPIYQLLFDAIKYSPYLSPMDESFVHTKIDRVYWGKTGIQSNEGLLFNDYLDCIELRFKSLKIQIDY